MAGKISYDQHYQTPNLFGDPYPELLRYFENINRNHRVLDLGCGQGRDAIALSRMGFKVTGIDHSEVGIVQMSKVAKAENLDLVGIVADVYTFDSFDEFEIILLDSMFHFTKRDLDKESSLIHKILGSIRDNSRVVFCLPDTRHIVQTLSKILAANSIIKETDIGFVYDFTDPSSGHHSSTHYRLIDVSKQDI